MCSWDWEVRQRCRVAEGLKQGKKGSQLRDFMITVAAEGKLENEFFHTLRELFTHPQLWEVIDDRQRNVRFRALCFRTLSRQGGCVKALIAAPHQSYPCKIFGLLKDPSQCAKLLEDRECCLDPWTAKLRHMYPTLEEPALQEVLYLHAQNIATNIAPIESQHASIRRQLHTRVQTWPLQFRTCSTEWMFQKLRQRRCRLARRATERGPLREGPRRKVGPS